MKAVVPVVALLLLLASACIEDVGQPSRSPTPGGPASTIGGSTLTATPPAVIYTPSANTPACAADSTSGFLEAQSRAPFKVYCPTFLPADFALEDIHFEETVQPGTPIPGPGSVIATFKRDGPDASVQFVQGRPALSVITDVRASSEGEPTDTLYADFQASLFEKGVLARSPDGYTHVIIADGLTADELNQTAAGMRPVVP
jgi:hypothetical protein